MSLLSQHFSNEDSPLSVFGLVAFSDRKRVYRWRINNKVVLALFEENRFYGFLLRQWSIDGQDHCPVRSRYTGEPLLLDSSNSLLGVRPFEKDSMILEFFIRPLGLPAEAFAYFECSDKIGYRVQPHNFED